MQRAFRTSQKFLDYDAPTRVSEATLIDHLIDYRWRCSSISRNDDSLAERQPVRFYHHWKFRSLTVTNRFATLGKHRRFGCGNLLLAHHFFCEKFGRFDPGGRFRGTKRA